MFAAIRLASSLLSTAPRLLLEIDRLNGRREAARIGERRKVLAARNTDHHHREVARRDDSTAPRREAAQEAARNRVQGAVGSIAQEAARNTHTGQRQAGRSGDR
jgi:hypothetical protein